MDIKKNTNAALEYLQAGDLDRAEHLFRDILKLHPENVTALHFIGVICYQRKEYDTSIEYIQKALRIAPDYSDAYNNLGIILQEIGRLDEAIASYLNAVKLNPHFFRAYYNLGTAFKEKGQIDQAIIHYQQAIQLYPDFAEAYNKLGNALQDMGRLEEADECYRHAMRLKPGCSPYFDNLLYMMNYDSRYNAQTLFSEHLAFAEKFEKPLASAIISHKNTYSKGQRIKIGYVSPDFRRHSVASFVDPILAAHRHEQFEIFCYSDVLGPDTITKRLQTYADQWRDIAGKSDEKAAELIRNDGIDILIDLAGHTGGNRLLLFARKPAPVQISWLGYPATTGLSAMDFKIVDGYTDPPGMTEPYYTEELIRLPESFLCYQPEKDSPGVGPLPALSSGHVSFGSFNYFPKVSPETAALWSAILNALPNARLIMKSRNFSDAKARENALGIFTRQGLSADRIELLSSVPSFTEHLNMYNRIDIALDTFPYNGTTTTCEALWMGVPVVTLTGQTHASRVGTSILSNVGLSDFIANSPEEYLQIAIGLANDIPRLRSVRVNVRNRMLGSAVMDAKRFTGNLEQCYRLIWERSCKTRNI
jgi:protein O-GlcNAc transferase